jgi:hypothetical protein
MAIRTKKLLQLRVTMKKIKDQRNTIASRARAMVPGDTYALSG